MSDDEETPSAQARPLLRIVRGDPSPEEVAALAVVLAAASGSGGATGSGPRSSWAARERMVRAPVRPGPGGWRASGLPL